MAVIICLKRNRNLHREDKVSVVAVTHGEGKKEFFQLIACIVIRSSTAHNSAISVKIVFP